MNPTPADVIAAARMQVYSKHPYLSTVLFALRPHPAPGLGTLAVDEGWRLYYDPEIVLKWQTEAEAGKMNKVAGSDDWHHGVAAVVFHELGHVLRQHFARRGERDPERWNAAGDREINDDLVESGWKLPVIPLLPEQIGMANGLTAEEYYPRSYEGVFIKRGCPGGGDTCGGIAGNPTQWEKDHASDEAGRSGLGTGERGGDASDDRASQQPPVPASSLEQEIALRKTAVDTLDHIKKHGRGTVPGGLRAWAEKHLESARVNWRQRLVGLIRQSLAACAGACDFTWRRTGRRSLYAAGRTGWPLAPALHQPVPRVCFVLDVSGSMSGKNGERTLQDEALSECLGIVKACGGAAWGVACDADVQAAARVTSVRDLEKLNKGGGGTIMTPGFLAAKKLKADLVVMVTDGQVGGGWPDQEQCRGVRVLAAIVGDHVRDVPKHIPFVKVE